MGRVDAGLGCLLCIGLLGEWIWSRPGRLGDELAGRGDLVGLYEQMSLELEVAAM